MSCKLERVVGRRGISGAAVSGRIDGEHVDTLRGVIGQEKGGMIIDVLEVMLVDREAAKLLPFSETHGAQIRNCRACIREWIERERDFGYGQCSWRSHYV